MDEEEAGGEEREEEPDYIDIIRERVPPRRNNARSGKNVMTVPAYRVNKVQEAKALQQAFARHKATTPELRMALVETILRNFKEATAYRQLCANANEFVSVPKYLATWLRADGWMDEFVESRSSLKERAGNIRRTCAHRGCERPADVRHNEKQWLCREHHEAIDPHTKMLEDVYRRIQREHPMESGETPREYYRRMRAQFKSGVKRA